MNNLMGMYQKWKKMIYEGEILQVISGIFSEYTENLKGNTQHNSLNVVVQLT